MKHKHSNSIFILFILAFLITALPGCRSADEQYDHAAWKKAFEKQEVLDAKPEKIAEIDQVFKRPRLAHLDDDYLYIYESKEWTVNIFSRKDYRLRGKFGGRGEGPGEFKRLHALRGFEDYVFVNSTGKNSYFTKYGKLIKEEKCPPHLIPCCPVGENYVTDDYEPPPPRGHRSHYTGRKIVLVEEGFDNKKILFQKKLNIAIIYKPETGRNMFTLFPDSCEFRTYKNHIYIGHSSLDGFYFTVFDSDGDLIRTITRPYQKRKIPERLKKAILKNPYRLHWNNQVLKLEFYKYLPSFSSFEVADDRIYVFQYPEDGNQRILILDLHGKLLGVVLIPFNYKSLESNSYQEFYNEKRIHKGAKYYLIDNTETNRLELWRQKLIKP